jgi:hypothetical protein
VSDLEGRVEALLAALEEAKTVQSVTLTGPEVIFGVAFLATTSAWLFLAVRIIWSATSDPNVLQNIEPLLLAMSILTLPVMNGFNKLMDTITALAAKVTQEKE